MSKKGLSGVITTVIMIALAIVDITVIWVFVTNFVNKGIEDSEACYNIFDKLTINGQYTCYNPETKELQFSISVGDIDLSSVYVAVSADKQVKSYILTDTNQSFTGMKNSTGGTSITMPSKNSGLTYMLNMTLAGFSGAPDSLRVYPAVNGKKCDSSDSFSEIDNCLSLT